MDNVTKIIKEKLYSRVICDCPNDDVSNDDVSNDIVSTINWSPTKCQMTICQNVIITTPGLLAGKVVRCSLRLQTFACPLLFYCWQIVIRTIVMHPKNCVIVRKMSFGQFFDTSGFGQPHRTHTADCQRSKDLLMFTLANKR